MAQKIHAIKLIDAISLQYCTSTCIYILGRPVEIFDIELFMETNGETVRLEPFKKTTGISRTRLEKPYILHELTLDVQERYGLQVHLYGSPVTEKLVAREGNKLELGFYNESPRVLSMTVMCIEQTGKGFCIIIILFFCTACCF